MLTLLRRRLIFKMLAEAKKQPPKSKAAFKRSVLGLFDCLPEPDLIAERNRIGEQRGGITRLISEAWIELDSGRREEEAIRKYWERVQQHRNEGRTNVVAFTRIP